MTKNKRADNGHKKKPNWPNKRSIYGQTNKINKNGKKKKWSQKSTKCQKESNMTLKNKKRP